MRHIAGLDGLRAVAVVVVVLFHYWPWLMPGGFLGVTLFFALSGYLITSTVLHEREVTGRVGIVAFYARRARRLLAASLATIAVVVVVWALAGWFTDQVADNAASAVVQAANWQRIVADQPYGTTAESLPLLHFWSLAIEEQIYWLFPLVAALGATRRRFAVPLVLVLVASAVASWRWSGDSVTVYYSTLTRAGELVAGALVALLLRGRTLPRLVARTAAPIAVAGTTALLVLCRLTSLDTASYYEGGLLLVGLLCALIVGALGAAPKLGRRLDHTVLVWVGRRSYGVYLVHWPLVLGLRQAGVFGAEWWALVATVLASSLSYKYLETPVRTRRLITHRPALVGIGVVAALTAVAVVLPTDRERVGGIDFAAAERVVQQLPAPTTDLPDTVPESVPGTVPESTVAPEPEWPVTWAIYGDSKALTLRLSAFALDDPHLNQLTGLTGMGCPLGRGGNVRESAREGLGRVPLPECDWTTLPAATLPAEGTDVVLAYFGSWDIIERNPPAVGGEWRTIEDDDYRTWLYSEMLALTDTLHAAGVAHVAWLTLYPAMGEPQRVELYNALLADIVVHRPEVAHVIDLGGWFSAQPDVDRLLPDGKHTTWKEGDPGTGLEVLQIFLVDQIVAIARPGATTEE